MRNKILLLVLLTAAILAGIYHLVNYIYPNHNYWPHEKISIQQPPAKPLTSDDYLDKLADTYRLKPDKRIVNAVSDIHAFLTNSQRRNVETKYVRDHWEVYYQDTLVGELPEYADFPEFLSLLEAWTKNIVARKSIKLTSTPLSTNDIEFIEYQLSLFYAPHAATATQRLNELWKEGNRTKELLPYAVRAMTLLTLQQLDYMEGAEQLPSHTVSLLALTKALTSHDVNREEVLLSYTLGYSAHARTLASHLEPDDVINAYVHHETDRVRSIASHNQNHIEAHYLLGLQLAELNKYKEWNKWFIKNTFTVQNMLPLLKTALEINKFSINKRIASTLPYSATVLLAYESGKENVESFMKLLNRVIHDEYSNISELYLSARAFAKASHLVAYLDTGTSLLKQKYLGPFLDGDTYGSFFQGHFYSGLYRIGLHYLDSLSSDVAAEAFTDYIGDPLHPIGADFQRWYQNLSKSKSGINDPQYLVRDLAEIKRFGAPPILRTLEEQKPFFGIGLPGIIQGVRAVIPHLDSRPEHQREFMHLVWDSLCDLSFYEKLADEVVIIDPARSQYVQRWLPYFKEDSNGLKRLLSEDDLTLSSKLKIFKYLEEMEQVSPQYLEDEYQKAFEKEPDNWSIVKAYIEFLMKEKKYKRVREVARNWLTDNEDYPGLAPVMIKTKIARSYLEEDNLDEAWETIKIVVPSYQGGAMHTAVDILEARGELDKAEKVARAVYERYPDSLTYCIRLAKHYWKRNMYQEAAEALKKCRVRINGNEWRFKVGKEFVETFKDRPDQSALSAYQSLLEQKVDQNGLFAIATEIGKSARYILATRMIEPLEFSRYRKLNAQIRSYGYLKKAKGDEAAFAWLNAQIPKEMRGPLSMIAYEEDQHDLMWSMIENPEEGEFPEFNWALRVCAYLKQGKKNDKHYHELKKHYEIHQSGDRYFIIGRYLLGMADESEVLALITNKKTECEVSYYIGLIAQLNGDYENATKWYRISMETGLNNNGEYGWSMFQLHRWRDKGKSLNVQKAQEMGNVSL